MSQQHVEILPPEAKPEDLSEPLLTEAEVATLLREHPERLRRMRYAGTGPTFCMWGYPPSPRYLRSDVMAWLECHRRSVMPPRPHKRKVAHDH